MASKKVDSLIGRQLGDYKIIGKLATGGMAQIYRAEDVKLGRAAAIKVLSQEILETDDLLTERFKREAQAVANLEHDNIISIYQYGEESDLYFLAMKLVEGEDLADELNALQRKSELMDVRRMLMLLKQVASALDFAHQAGIVHRDVKPSNILIDKNDRAILTDFGLVLRQQVDKTMGTAFGTPRYISPEQALASERSVPQSDIYSLAVIVYEILTGSMVFKADTAMQIALSHISEPPPRPTSVNPDIPKAVEREVLKALDKEPKKRHETAAEFIQALEDAYGDQLEKTPNKSLPEAAINATPVVRPDIPETPVLDSDPVADDPTMPYDVLEERRKKDSDPKAPPIPAAVVPGDDESTSPLRPEELAKNERKTRRKRRSPVLTLILLILIAGIGGFGAIVAVGDASSLEAALRDFSLRINVSPGESTRTVSAADDDEDEVDPTEVPAVIAATDEATATPTEAATEEAVVTLAPNTMGEPLAINYDFNGLVIANSSAVAFDVSELNIVADEMTFSGERISQGIIPAGECVVVNLQGREPDIPATCDDVHNQIQLPATSLFWRVINGPAAFEVRLGNAIVVTCDTLERGADATCDLTWPAVIDE